MASTGMGSDGSQPLCQLKGATEMPHNTITISNNAVINLLLRKYLMNLFSILHVGLRVKGERYKVHGEG